MRTLEQFRQLNRKLIENNEGLHRSGNVNPNDPIRKDVKLNRLCILALEQGQTESDLQKQLDVCQATIVKLESEFTNWKHNTPNLVGNPNGWKGKYGRLMGIPKLKEQEKFLKYILQ